MFRFSLGQLRSSLRHSGAMALAIIVATAFIVAALAGSAVMRRTMLNIVSEQYGSADLVVSLGLLGEGTQVPLSAQDDAAQVPGVAAAFLPVAVSGVITTSTDATEWTLVRSLSTNPQLSGWPVAAGREPATGGEVSLATSLANRCDIALGDTVSLTVNLYREEKAVAEAEAAAAGEGTDPAGPLDAGEADGTASGEGTGAAGPRDAGEGSVLSDESVATGYDGGVVEATVQLTVTGLFDDSLPSFWDRPAAQVLPETLAQLGVFADSVAPPQVGELLIAVEPGQDPAKLAPQVAAGLAAAWDAQAPALGCADGIVAGEGYCRVGAQTTAAATSQAAAYYLEQADAVTAVGLVAAAVSLLVAFLVIANTFQVMLAGRIRALGLLRAVGATRQQVRGTVLTEALVMGVGAAAVGVGAGWALIAGAIWAAHEMYPAIPLPPSVEMAPWVAGLALVVGVGATVTASLGPARFATTVAPIEALRPLRAPSLATPPGRHRFLWSVVCVLVGMVLLFGGLIMTHQLVELPTSLDYQFFAGVVTGTLGGALVALGLIMGAVFWIPKVVGAVARVLARAGSPARMAAANLVRNPRRTAATVTALLVGVTLVSGLIVTASSLERTLSARIDTGVPVDVQVGHPFGGWFYPSEIDWTRDYLADQSLETGVVERLRAVEGVEAVAVIGEAMVAIPNDEGEPIYYLVAVTDPDALANAINLPEAEVPLAEGVILVSDSMNWMISNPEGDPAATYTFADKDEAWGAGASDPSGSLAPLAEVDGTSREVWAVADSGDDAGDGGDGIGGDSAEILFLYSPLLDQFSASMMMDQATLEQLGGEAQVNAVWLKIARSSDALAVEESIAEIVSGASTGDYAAPVVSEAVRRAETHKAIDTMVLIGLALLAAAVVVALIGVSNTLSLSVIERRHELALLRALGLTRGQTRWMLAVEGAAIATVAGLMGVLLGTGFAFAATSLVMGPFEGSIWAVPWGRLALVLGLAVVTGFAASALPGRRAAKTAPSRALAQI